MAISIDWGSLVITVPQADLTFISGSLYELDTNQFRLDVLDLLDNEVGGIVAEDVFIHNTEVTLAGITFARTIEIINGYTITFTPDISFRVRFVGSNNNFSDVVNLNSVSLLQQNSAGLIVTASGAADWTVGEKQQLRDALGIGGVKAAAVGGQLQNKANTGAAMTLTVAERDAVAAALLDLANGVETGFTPRQTLRLIAAVLCGKSSGGPGSSIFRNLQDNADRVASVANSNGDRSSVTLTP